MRRPFTGAWIETAIRALADHVTAGRPFTGAWIETLSFLLSIGN